MDSKDFSDKTEYEIKSSVNGITEVLYNHYKLNKKVLLNSDPEKYSVIFDNLGVEDKDLARISTFILINSFISYILFTL